MRTFEANSWLFNEYVRNVWPAYTAFAVDSLFSDSLLAHLENHHGSVRHDRPACVGAVTIEQSPNAVLHTGHGSEVVALELFGREPFRVDPDVPIHEHLIRFLGAPLVRDEKTLSA